MSMGDPTSGEIGSALEPQGHDAAASDRVVVVMRPGASSAEVLAIWRSLADSHSGFVNAAGFTSLADDQTLRAVLRLPAIEAGQLVLTAEVDGNRGSRPVGCVRSVRGRRLRNGHLRPLIGGLPLAPD